MRCHVVKTLINYFRFGKKYFDLAAKLLAKHALHKIAGKTYKILALKAYMFMNMMSITLHDGLISDYSIRTSIAICTI